MQGDETENILKRPKLPWTILATFYRVYYPLAGKPAAVARTPALKKPHKKIKAGFEKNMLISRTFRLITLEQDAEHKSFTVKPTDSRLHIYPHR